MATAIRDVVTKYPVTVEPHDIEDLALARDERSALADISGAPANQ